MNQSSSNNVQSLSRAISILSLLAKHPDGCSIKTLSEESGLAKSTAHRLVQCLKDEGFAYQDSVTENYHLGMKILELSAEMLGNMDIRKIAHPVLDECCSKTGDTVHLCILNDNDTVYIDKVFNPNKALQMYSQIGKRIPVYCSAAGKALTTWLESNARDSLISSIRFEKFTKHTITSKKSFMNELEKVRKRGYAYDVFEHEENIFCLSAPVFDNMQKAVAAVSISATYLDLNDSHLSLMRDEIYHAAVKISSYLGCTEYPVQIEIPDNEIKMFKH